MGSLVMEYEECEAELERRTKERDAAIARAEKAEARLAEIEKLLDGRGEVFVVVKRETERGIERWSEGIPILRMVVPNGWLKQLRWHLLEARRLKPSHESAALLAFVEDVARAFDVADDPPKVDR